MKIVNSIYLRKATPEEIAAGAPEELRCCRTDLTLVITIGEISAVMVARQGTIEHHKSAGEAIEIDAVGMLEPIPEGMTDAQAKVRTYANALIGVQKVLEARAREIGVLVEEALSLLPSEDKPVGGSGTP